MGKLIALMGPTGAGKSVQGDLLAEALDGVHLSSGTLLRRDPHAAAMLEDGRLAPAAEVHRVLGEAIDKIAETKAVILDGTPRTMNDVAWLDTELHTHRRKLAQVILIELDLETSLTRLHHRDRADDSPEAVREKWLLFGEKTKPVIEHYESLGLLVRVDGRGTVDEVHQSVMKVLT